MLNSIEGIYRNGKVELSELPPAEAEGPVIVTFLAVRKTVYLADRGIGQQQAADLRGRLASFAEDWQQPEMDVYDAL